MGRRDLFRGRSAQSGARHSAGDFWQRVFHHGNLSAAEHRGAVHFADERNCRKYVCAGHGGGPHLRKSWRSDHPFDHGDFHAELPQCQSAFLFADAPRDELRWIIFPARRESQCRRHAGFFATTEHHRGHHLCAGIVERVIAMLSFFFVANYTLTYTSLFVLRKKEPQMDRPYRAWGYPWTTAIALIGSVLFLIGSIATDRDNAPWALAMLVLSYPVYRVMKIAANRETT